jgi:hypothetical protein
MNTEKKPLWIGKDGLVIVGVSGEGKSVLDAYIVEAKRSVAGTQDDTKDAPVTFDDLLKVAASLNPHRNVMPTR